jgi:hypothetical protein
LWAEASLACSLSSICRSIKFSADKT